MAPTLGDTADDTENAIRDNNVDLSSSLTQAWQTTFADTILCVCSREPFCHRLKPVVSGTLNLKTVDYVFIDPSKKKPDETDPIHAEILKNLNPDFYVTDGPDPRFYNLIEKSKFIILDRLNPEPSTTSIINRILDLGN